MENCIFCKIINNEIPSKKIYEDKNAIAILDISPVNKGHALVISKQHYENILNTPDNILRELIIIAKKISKAVMQSLNAQGINIGINNFKAAGQLVMHTHIHIIPRFNNDGLKHWPGKKYENNEIKQFLEKIKTFLK